MLAATSSAILRPARSLGIKCECIAVLTVSCTLVQGYTPPEAKESEYQTIPMSKIEDFGVHANQYYALEVSLTHSYRLRQTCPGVHRFVMAHGALAYCVANGACQFFIRTKVVKARHVFGTDTACAPLYAR